MKLAQRAASVVAAPFAALGGVMDRAILGTFPGWGVRRLQARAKARLFRMAERSEPVSSSQASRLSARGWTRKGGPKTATQRDLETIRATARDQYRRNPYARGVINSIVANLVGVGIIPQARVRHPKKFAVDEKFNDAAEDAWKRWADACDRSGKESFYSLQAQIQRDYYIAGEALLAFNGEVDDKREVPTSVELISSERLELKDELDRRDGKKVIQGVQFGADGIIEGYWIFPNHPYDTVYGSDKSRLVPASNVLHFYERLEAETVRGISKFLPVADAFDAFEQWLNWILAKERIAAAFAVAITEAHGLTVNSPTNPESEEELVDQNGNPIDVLEGGMVMRLNPGEDVRGINSGVQASSVDLLSQVFLRVIARGLDVAYELVARDLSKVTYLSARQGENQDRRHWEPQQEALNRTINVPVWREFIRVASMAGVLPYRGQSARIMDVDFVRPGWDWIDPGKDIAANEAGIRAGIVSPQAVIAAKGGDAYKVLSELAQFKAWAKELGLVDHLSIFQPAKGAQAASDVSEPKEKKVDDETP